MTKPPTLKLPENKLSSEINKISKAIAKVKRVYKTTPRAFLVGGYVRDLALGRKATEADMEVFGLSYYSLKTVLEKLHLKGLDEKGKKYGVIRVNFPTFNVDLSLPRTETKSGQGYFDFKLKINPDLNLKKAALRRDFTVNSIYLDPLTGMVLDPYNGLKDLKSKTIKAVNFKKFSEDPTRLLRAIQFSARLNFSFELKTLQLLKTMANSPEVVSLKPQFFKKEFSKLKTLKQKQKAQELCLELGLNTKTF